MALICIAAVSLFLILVAVAGYCLCFYPFMRCMTRCCGMCFGEYLQGKVDKRKEKDRKTEMVTV